MINHQVKPGKTHVKPPSCSGDPVPLRLHPRRLRGIAGAQGAGGGGWRGRDLDEIRVFFFVGMYIPKW